MRKKILLPLLITAVLWFIMFSPWTAQYINFWYSMSCSAIILWFLCIWLSPNFKQQFHFNYIDVFLGIVSAILLWIIFLFGDIISKWLFDFAAPQINSIYQIKDKQNILYISLALTFVIGPAEEIFWRGYLQRTLTGRYGRYIAYISTALIYALVHIWSFNFMLVMAALICGLFWGLLYMYRHNLITNILSHALWDVTIFILFPIN